jgi:hypothetical protein
MTRQRRFLFPALRRALFAHRLLPEMMFGVVNGGSKRYRPCMVGRQAASQLLAVCVQEAPGLRGLGGYVRPWTQMSGRVYSKTFL